MALRHFLHFLFLFLLPYCCVAGEAPFFILRPVKSGLFDEMRNVLASIRCYEDKLFDQVGGCAGIRVDFGKEGLYYDPTKGENYWEYYFEPISLGDSKKGITRPVNTYDIMKIVGNAFYKIFGDFSPQFKKHIKVKPFILKQVDDICNEHFSNAYVIGVHYRGTDKFIEAKPITYEQAYKAALQEVNKTSSSKQIKIFVASDEQAFVDYMEKKFPNMIIKSNALRSTNKHPIHVYNQSPFKAGEGALIDCLLLSRCDFLVRTISCLTDIALHFNPNLQSIVLNRPNHLPEHERQNLRSFFSH